ncbi:MAG: tRNA (guanosine(37)-N1)-methyltransferase TrmD [Gammaproteobacteria bacterium]|nr:tRNA (guanosine(37)-N1)-methyltransferase TrmD [Gammaproteobacteria bacterium]
MQFDLITLFPEMFDALVDCGITGRAYDRSLYRFATHNPRDFTADPHQTVDGRPYGGGPGMVMRAEPLRAAIAAARQNGRQQGVTQARVIYLSPQGATLTQTRVQSLAEAQQLILLCGRYEGIDERLLQLEVDEELSIGDYVLSGGELAAMVVMDAIIRLLPGALGDALSAAQDSFSEGLLDCPHYTRPEVYAGLAVPSELLSGHHGGIARWRQQQALLRTWQRRPDLLEKIDPAHLSDEQQSFLRSLKKKEAHLDL